jgi:hypothetical protein
MMASKLTSLLILPAALTALLLPACSADSSDGKEEAVDETTSAFGLGDTRISGSLDYGQTSASTSYTHNPRYRAFKFAGNAGDDVEVWVKSANGDPVTWILDNDWRAIAKNDDASYGDTNSHIKTKLPANASATHYIVVRDYYQDPMSFKIELKGGPADFVSGCTTDSDCAKVDKACCSNYGSIAVLGSKAAAYKASLACTPPTICPAFMLKQDFAAPECNQATKKCEMVKPADIKCGGFINPAMQHACPGGYNCKHIGFGINPDVPGKCVQFCGGIAGFQCHDDNEECVDDPTDSCDPAHGGADCGGMCQGK